MQTKETPAKDAEGEYNFAEHRELAHPTSDFETLVHILKGSLGSGILAMPLAFASAGLIAGLVLILIVGFACTYCIHILVKSAQELYRRNRVPSLDYAGVAEMAFQSGPSVLAKYSKVAKQIVDWFIVVDLLSCCCIYIVFVAKNLKQVVEFYLHFNCNIRIYMAILWLPLTALSFIRYLKLLAVFSLAANIFIATALSITFYYIFDGLPPFSSRPVIVSVLRMPLFFGTSIFALECIGVVLSLENNMKTPTHFIGCPGVVNIGMSFVVTLYALLGFFGFWRYGEDTKGSITLNLPKDQYLSQSVKLMIAVAILLTYPLQFYPPIEIILKKIANRYGPRNLLQEYLIRFGLVTGTVLIAIAVPNLGGFISLVGAVCLSTLGLMFPAIIDLVTFYGKFGFGRFKWRLLKNLALFLFGIFGFFIGSYYSVVEIIEDLMSNKSDNPQPKNATTY